MTNENETVGQVYSSCENVMVWDFPDGPMKYARRFLAAHMREIAEKDAEIASLRALVKESIELLKNVNEVEFVDVTAWFDGCVDAEQQEWLDSAIGAIHKCQLAFDGLIAKAREALHGQV